MRKPDIAPFVRFFVASFKNRKFESRDIEATITYCTSQLWPGNVRQLENTVKYACNNVRGSEGLIGHIDEAYKLLSGGERRVPEENVNTFSERADNSTTRSLKKKIVLLMPGDPVVKTTSFAKDIAKVRQMVLDDKVKYANVPDMCNKLGWELRKGIYTIWDWCCSLMKTDPEMNYTEATNQVQELFSHYKGERVLYVWLNRNRASQKSFEIFREKREKEDTGL